MNEPMIDWYFDFISPYAYLQWHRLRREAPQLAITPKPVLFAGLLSHWDNKGPAEITPKRSWTYAHCLWLARRYDIPMQLPTAHPFNPLPLLRLSLALGATEDVVDRLFGYVWRDGRLPSDEDAWQDLLDELLVEPAEINAEAVKHALHRNCEEAIEAGVFGVPTAVVDGELFWGVDATDMLLAYVAGDPFFRSDGYAMAHTLPAAVHRKK
jgi:2-hydroxychromene-2-carboxylate isomerase